jgi:hypothetical protein
VTDATNLYQKARIDVATMLGYDLDALSPEQSTRVDVATALRVLLDTQSGRLVRGESLDARELLMASEALSRLLPPLREPPSEPREDPRQVLWRIYSEMRSRGEVPPEGWHQHRIDAQAAEIAALKAQLVGAGLTPALPDSTVITPPLADIVPPGELGDCYAGMRPGPDDPPPRSTTVIDGKAAAAPAAAPQPRMVDLRVGTGNSDEPWRQFVEPDGTIRTTPRGRGHYWGPV